MREKVEDHYWSCDGLYKQYVRGFVVHIGGNESDSGTIVSDDSDSDHDTNDGGSSDEDPGNDSENYVCTCEGYTLGPFPPGFSTNH